MNTLFLGYSSIPAVTDEALLPEIREIHSTRDEAAAACPTGTVARTYVTTQEGEYFLVKQGSISSTNGLWYEDVHGRRLLGYLTAYNFAAGRGRDGSRAEIVIMTPTTEQIMVGTASGNPAKVGTTTTWAEVAVGSRIMIAVDSVTSGGGLTPRPTFRDRTFQLADKHEWTITTDDEMRGVLFVKDGASLLARFSISGRLLSASSADDQFEGDARDKRFLAALKGR